MPSVPSSLEHFQAKLYHGAARASAQAVPHTSGSQPGRGPYRRPAQRYIKRRKHPARGQRCRAPITFAYGTGMAGGFEPMINDIYNARILALAAEIPRLGRLQAPQATAKAHSRLCGSTVVVDLAMDGDTVSDFAHEVRACALGQASSSLMARHVVGAKAADLRALRQTMLKMLKENGPPPEGAFDEFKVLEPIRDYKARHASTMLTFDAVVDCIDQIEAARAGVANSAAE